jgi:glycosyltransferase involved in cell wall biosynthesis
LLYEDHKKGGRFCGNTIVDPSIIGDLCLWPFRQHRFMALRIAQIAPLAESVPPRAYGGTERVCSWLTEELVSQGHDVTLFASADSSTSAQLAPCCPVALREAGVRDHAPSLLLMLDRVRRLADSFDVIHFHVDLYQFPLFQELASKSLTTLHGRLDLPEMHPVYRTFNRMPLVSISEAQRRPIADANWIATVQHGMPGSLIPFSPSAGKYLAFLGRISPEKRPDRAIEIAIRAGIPLKLAAKVDWVDQQYFEATVKPWLDHPLIEFLGEVDDSQKREFLGGALALLFPIDWPEPFGLAMIEAMSAGTPVIAWRNGSVPEVVDVGVTGFIVESIDQAVEALERVSSLDRLNVRERFEQRFAVERMARDYLALYRRAADVTDAEQIKFSIGQGSR